MTCAWTCWLFMALCICFGSQWSMVRDVFRPIMDSPAFHTIRCICWTDSFGFPLSLETCCYCSTCESHAEQFDVTAPVFWPCVFLWCDQWLLSIFPWGNLPLMFMCVHFSRVMLLLLWQGHKVPLMICAVKWIPFYHVCVWWIVCVWLLRVSVLCRSHLPSSHFLASLSTRSHFAGRTHWCKCIVFTVASKHSTSREQVSTRFMCIFIAMRLKCTLPLSCHLASALLMHILTHNFLLFLHELTSNCFRPQLLARPKKLLMQHKTKEYYRLRHIGNFCALISLSLAPQMSLFLLLSRFSSPCSFSTSLRRFLCPC